MTRDGGWARSSSGLRVAVSGCLAGALLMWLGGSEGWVCADYGSRTVAGTTSECVSAGTAGRPVGSLVLVALAGAGALLAVRGAARRVVGVLLLGVAAGAVAAVVATAADVAGAAQRGATPTGVVTGATIGLGAVVAGVGGVLLLASSVLILVAGPSWPALSRRFDAPEARRADGSDSGDAWSALDRGEDPTDR
jgi:uncharacterized membrane protein (TIGR02234 family)